GRTGSAQAVPVLEKIASASQNTVRTLAIVSLGRVEGGNATIKNALGDPNVLVRAGAAWAAAHTGDNSLVPTLQVLVREDEELVSALAAWSLGVLGGHESVDILLDAYWSQKPMLREAAAAALVR